MFCYYRLCLLLHMGSLSFTSGGFPCLLRDQGRCLLSSKPRDSDFLYFNPKIETGISHGNSREPDFHESRRISRNPKDLQGMCCQLDEWRLRHPAGHWPGMKAWAASLFIYIIVCGCACVIYVSMCACTYICVHMETRGQHLQSCTTLSFELWSLIKSGVSSLAMLAVELALRTA